MSEKNPWVVVATFCEELSPVIQPALDAVVQVCNAVSKADNRLALERTTVVEALE